METTDNTKIEARALIGRTKGNWIGGIVGDHTFEAKVYDNPSSLGINEGRISKLEIRNPQNKAVLYFDRGWDIDPTEATQPYLDAVLHLFNS